MPTFTDAALIVAGSGTLLLAVLATAASSRRRTWAGLAGFTAIEIATFVRYTNIVILGCAVMAGIMTWRLRAARLPIRTLCGWLASVAVFGAGVAIFNDLVYGGPLTSGYRPGEITFGLGAIRPNLWYLPAHLMQAMPMLVVVNGEAIFGPAIAKRLMTFFATVQPEVPARLFPELTEREREILSLLAQHHSNPDIAARLTLSPKTVRNHVSNIFDKLQVTDRAQAILKARDAGLK